MFPELEPPRLVYVYSAPLLKQCGHKEVVQLAQKKERELILKALTTSERRFRFCAEIATTFLLRRLLNKRCDMLHFSGHGDENFLAFESSLEEKCGLEELLAVEPLKKLFQAGGVRTKLVFINSCCSEMSGNAFVEAGVPHVVAVKKKEGISDQAARHFSELFYDALIQDGGKYTLKEAFDIACNTVNTADSRAPLCEGNHFLLLPEGGNHDVHIFGSLQEGELVDETRVLPPRPLSCKRAVSSYKGLRGLQKVVGLLVDTDAACVTVTGENGSGKTERAIQAFDYVRERHHFDAYLWADCDKTMMEIADAAAVFPSHWRVDSVFEDPCRVIGIALGMDSPGPASEEELHQFLFKDPWGREGPPAQEVLLVLENADSLLERGEDSRDRLVTLLSNLCSVGGRRHLKLLVTSERRLQPGTDARFRSGAEVEAKVERLKFPDDAKLLVENLPRKLTKRDLGLQSCVSAAGLLEAVQEHAVLKEVLRRAGGHPGTLLALAPNIFDVNADTLKEMTDKHREDFRGKDYRLRRHRRGSSGGTAISTSRGAGGSPGDFRRGVSWASSVCAGNCRSPTGSPTAPGPLQHLGQASSVDTLFPCNNNSNHWGSLPHGMAFSDGARFQHVSSSSSGGGGASFWFRGRGGSGSGGDGSSGGARDPVVGGTTSPLPAFSGAFMLEETSGGAYGGAGTSSAARCDRICCREQPSPSQPPPCCRQYRPRFQERRRGLTATRHPSRRFRFAQGGGEPEPPRLSPEQLRSWYRAAEMGVKDPGCRLVWATAAANTADGGARSGGGGGGGGFFFRGRQVPHHECVSWGRLKRRLMEHLRGKLTAPARQRDDPVDDGPYDAVTIDTEDEDDDGEEEEEEDDDDDDKWGEEGSWYEPVNTRPSREVDEAGLGFIRELLGLDSEGLRAQPDGQLDASLSNNTNDRGAAPAADGLTAGGGGGGGNGGDDDTTDVISLAVFAKFARWWAPLVATLFRVRGDWESTEPVRIHGFVGRTAAKEQLLRQGRLGTFMLRVSASVRGSLVLSYTEREVGNPRCLAVKNCLVKVGPDGACSMKEDRVIKTYAALHDLVRMLSPLKTLYPDIPKEEAFDLAPVVAGSGRSGRGGAARARDARGVSRPVPILRAEIGPPTVTVVAAPAAPASFTNSPQEAPVAVEGRDESGCCFADGDSSEPEEDGGGAEEEEGEEE